jgi:hypothetical protein
MQIPPTNPLKRFSGDDIAFGILATKTPVKRGVTVVGFAVFSFAERSTAQDFSGNEISIADNSLQRTAKTASRCHLLPTPPAGSVQLVNAAKP